MAGFSVELNRPSTEQVYVCAVMEVGGGMAQITDSSKEHHADIEHFHIPR